MTQPLFQFSAAFQTSQFKKEIDAFLVQWLAIHDLPEKAQLYHYTTLTGMQGIIKERSLWFSHVSTLNDRLEIQYGQKVVRNVLQELIDSQSRAEIKELLQSILGETESFDKVFFHTFVACFCRCGNLLSQWRAYANRGGGYCLGFEITPTVRIASDLDQIIEGSDVYLRKVIYNEQEQRKLVREYLERVLAAATKSLDGGSAVANPEMPAYPISLMALDASNVLFDMIISFKHTAFETEEEWRLVRVMAEHYEPEGLSFREGIGGLIPYRSILIYDKGQDGITKFPLRSIGFGPILEPTRSRAAIALLLQSIASDNHQIRLVPSSINIHEAGFSLRPDGN